MISSHSGRALLGEKKATNDNNNELGFWRWMLRSGSEKTKV